MRSAMMRRAKSGWGVRRGEVGAVAEVAQRVPPHSRLHTGVGGHFRDHGGDNPGQRHRGSGPTETARSDRAGPRMLGGSGLEDRGQRL